MDTVLSQYQPLDASEIKILIKSLENLLVQKCVEEDETIVRNLAPGQIHVSLHELKVPAGISYTFVDVMARLSLYDTGGFSDWWLSGVDMANNQPNVIVGILKRDDFWERIKSQIKRFNVELPNASDWKAGDGVTPATTNKAAITIFYYWRSEPYPEAEKWITDLGGVRWNIWRDHTNTDDHLYVTREEWESDTGEFPFFIVDRSSDASTSNV